MWQMAFPVAFIGGSMSGGEILIILVALLMLFGSKNLPGIARQIGKSMEAFRRASREVTDEIMRADIERETRPAKPLSPPKSPASNGENVAEHPDDATPAVKPSEQSVGRHESPSA